MSRLFASLLAAGALTLSHAGMILTGVQIDEAGLDSDLLTGPLRGPENHFGDVWGPAMPGTNILECGAIGNEGNINTRATVSMGEDFTLTGRVFQGGNGQDTIKLSIKYGESPNFGRRGYEFQTLKLGVMDLPFDWSTSVSLPEPGYNYQATVQVEYVTGRNITSSSGQSSRLESKSYFQCVDLEVTGGAAFPAGDYRYGLSPATNEVAKVQGTEPPLAVVEENTGLSGGQTVLIVLVVLLLVGIVIGAAYHFAPAKEKEEEIDFLPPVPEYVPKPVVAVEQVQVEIDVPVEREPSGGSKREEKEPEEPEESNNNSREPSEPVVTGSMGRHFHFRYVEGDDEYAEEDKGKSP